MTISCSTASSSSGKYKDLYLKSAASVFVDLVGLTFGTFGTLEIYLHDAP